MIKRNLRAHMRKNTLKNIMFVDREILCPQKKFIAISIHKIFRIRNIMEQQEADVFIKQK